MSALVESVFAAAAVVSNDPINVPDARNPLDYVPQQEYRQTNDAFRLPGFQIELQPHRYSRQKEAVAKAMESELARKAEVLRIMSEADAVRHIFKTVAELPHKDDGVADVWSSPDESIMAGGDCEDAALIGYAMLRASGMPSDRVRVVILRERPLDRVDHAVVMYMSAAGPVVIDQALKGPTLLSRSRYARWSVVASIDDQKGYMHVR